MIDLTIRQDFSTFLPNIISIQILKLFIQESSCKWVPKITKRHQRP